MKRIKPFQFDHTIQVNASKSHLQRALAISLLSQGRSVLKGCDESNDVLACKNIITDLGCTVLGDENLEIIPPLLHKREQLSIHVQESGLALRMFSFISTLFSDRVKIYAEGSLVKRSIEELRNSLQNAGRRIEESNEIFPIEIKGQIDKSEIFLDGSFSSQMLSGLLISAPLLNHDTVIHVNNLSSKPYVDLTLEIMRDFGVDVEHQDYKIFHILGNQKYIGREYQIKGDWSGAANHIVGAAISGEARIVGLQFNSKQADKIILDIIDQFGAKHEWRDDILIISKTNESNPIQVDLTNNPDLFPILAVLACSVNGTSQFFGTNRLLHKESNRLKSVIEMLNVFNVDYSLSENSIEIHGTGEIVGGKVACYNDHRMAMAATVAGCFSKEEIILDNEICIKKSYPEFFNVLGL